jgi:hypothetical protein
MHDSKAEFFLTLEISSTTASPLAIKQRFGIDAAFTSDDAAARLGRAASELALFWSLSTRGKVDGNRLVEHLRWIADELVEKEGALQWAREHESVHLYAWGPNREWQRDIAADERERARLAIPLSFTVSVSTTRSVRVDNDIRHPGP